MSNAIDFPYTIPEETLWTMAREKLLQDADTFTDWLTAECMEPTDVRMCKFFGAISTARMVMEILLNENAVETQITAAARELRARYLMDNQEAVNAEFQRLRSES